MLPSCLDNNKVSLSQKADFPWNGKVEVSVNPEKPMKFAAEAAHTRMGSE